MPAVGSRTAPAAAPPAAVPLPDDRPLRWRAALMALGAGVTAWFLTRLLSLFPLLADAVAGMSSGPLTRALSALSGAVPLSVAELLLGGYTAWLLLVAGRAAGSAVRGRRRWRNALGGGARRVARDAGCVVAAFYLCWGFNYAQPPFPERAGWPPFDGVPTAELVALAEDATRALNAAYRELHGSDDAGTPTRVPADPGELQRLEAAIDEGWRRSAELLSLPPTAMASFGAVKRPWLTPVLGRLGIAGIYVPFTAEASVLRGAPALRLPMSMAHEKAHQRGYTSEADANFLGFVAAALAPDPRARYAAAYFAHGQLLSAVGPRAPEEWYRIRALRAPGVEHDRKVLLAFWSRYRGVMMEVGSGLNNSFLLANGVEGGTESYRGSVWQMVALARLQSGRLLPRWEGREQGGG